MILFQWKSGVLLANGLLLLFVYVANAQPPVPTIFSNTKICSNIGTSLFRRGGSAVDAAIATFFCENFYKLEGFALGGGFVMKLWDSRFKRGSILTAKEQIPESRKKAHQQHLEKLQAAAKHLSLELFTDKKKVSSEESTELPVAVTEEEPSSTESNKGKVRDGSSEKKSVEKKKIYKGKGTLIENAGSNIEIPGIIAGFWAAHQKYGRLPWADLWDYIIALNANRDNEGIIVNPKLVETLRKIRDYGKDVFYRGEIAEQLVKEIHAAGGLTTLDDFKNYQPEWEGDIFIPKTVEFREKNNLDVAHASVVGPDGFCVTVTSSNDKMPNITFKSRSTGIILKAC